MTPPPTTPATWTPRDAEKLYNMPGWGLGFFRANADGHVTVHADGDPAHGLDLYQLAMDLQAQGVGLPLLLRFSDILRARISQLAEVFRSAIAEFGYEGSYTTVYPIKVNQQRHDVMIGNEVRAVEVDQGQVGQAPGVKRAGV